jgi:uncharacterized protein (UPF0303 family)
MDFSRDLEVIARQEAELRFPTFTEAEAWELGSAMQALAATSNLKVVIDVSRLDRQLFFASMPGTTFDTQDWCRRKRNVVTRFGQSSYHIEQKMKASNSTLAARYGLAFDEYAAAGGAFPILVDQCGMIGAVTVSGLASRADHNLIVDAICTMLGLDDPSLLLGS